MHRGKGHKPNRVAILEAEMPGRVRPLQLHRGAGTPRTGFLIAAAALARKPNNVRRAVHPMPLAMLPHTEDELSSNR